MLVWKKVYIMLRFVRHIPPYLPTILVVVAICYISLSSDPFPDKERWLNFPGSDKVVHFIMYGGLTATFCFDYHRRHAELLKPWLFVAVLAVAIVIGAVMEWLQMCMEVGRTGDILDFVANSLGACLGIVAGKKIFARLFAIYRLQK